MLDFVRFVNDKPYNHTFLPREPKGSPMFFDRERDIADLNDILQRPGAQFMIVSGRRRVGKTSLLIEWAKRSELVFFYWVASASTSGFLLQSLSQKLFEVLHPGEVIPANFTYSNWGEAFEELARLAAHRRLIVILDEFPYVIDADPAVASLLQNAWDHHLKRSQIFLALSGSHISLMNQMQSMEAPLYGRFTAQLRTDPLPFRALRQFYPAYDAEKRVAVYAMLGGIPAYLEQFKDNLTIRENVERHFFKRTAMLRSEPEVLIGDLVREKKIYLALIKAIAEGKHTHEEIVKTGLVAPGNVGKYLARLIEMQFVERRVPITVPPQSRTTHSRYYVSDPFLRFYYRFIETNRDKIELELMDDLWLILSEQLRAFIGGTAFEELSRQWVLLQARAHQLPFIPQMVSSHWSGNVVQVDVAAISWRERALLLGESKWMSEPLNRSIVRELIEEKTPKVLVELPDQGRGWDVHYALFSRAGFTPEATQYAREHNARLVDVEQLDRDLSG